MIKLANGHEYCGICAMRTDSNAPFPNLCTCEQDAFPPGTSVRMTCDYFTNSPDMRECDGLTGVVVWSAFPLPGRDVELSDGRVVNCRVSEMIKHSEPLASAGQFVATVAVALAQTDKRVMPTGGEYVAITEALWSTDGIAGRRGTVGLVYVTLANGQHFTITATETRPR